MEFAVDIQKKLEQDFGSELAGAKDEIEALYAKTNWQIGNRIIRSIIYLANGDLESLKTNIEFALADHQDVVWLAEYDRGDEQLRNFSKTFQELGLLQS
ncbi:MAG: hypothetical protein V7752_17440 [Halopseudomonas sp.]